MSENAQCVRYRTAFFQVKCLNIKEIVFWHTYCIKKSDRTLQRLAIEMRLIIKTKGI